MVETSHKPRSPKRILVFGASGLLGSRLYLRLQKDHQVTGTFWQSPLGDLENLVKLSASKTQDLEIVFNRFQPEVVINCLGLTSVDDCEARPEAAWLLNTLFPAALAKMSAKSKSKFIHISTDHFSSSRQNPRSEDAPMKPVNQYGLSKLTAEEFILALNADSTILRTNFFGLNSQKKNSILDFAVDSLSNNEQTRGATDITFTPIGVSSLVEFISNLLLLPSAGILNVAGNDELTKLEFIRIVCRVLKLNSRKVQPARMSDFGLRADRPSYLSLNSDMVARNFGFVAPPIEKMIREELSMMGHA
jgi:dTDP-4-dehydrorhamnose reductase